MIPQVGGFRGCYLDNHRNNWRCARTVRALCARCARAVRALCENAPTGLSKHGDPVFPHFCPLDQNLARLRLRGLLGASLMPGRVPKHREGQRWYVVVESFLFDGFYSGWTQCNSIPMGFGREFCHT